MVPLPLPLPPRRITAPTLPVIQHRHHYPHQVWLAHHLAILAARLVVRRLLCSPRDRASLQPLVELLLPDIARRPDILQLAANLAVAIPCLDPGLAWRLKREQSVVGWAGRLGAEVVRELLPRLIPLVFALPLTSVVVASEEDEDALNVVSELMLGDGASVSGLEYRSVKPQWQLAAVPDRRISARRPPSLSVITTRTCALDCFDSVRVDTPTAMMSGEASSGAESSPPSTPVLASMHTAATHPLLLSDKQQQSTIAVESVDSILAQRVSPTTTLAYRQIIRTGSSPAASSQPSFSLMSWNLLAPNFCTAQRFPHLDTATTLWCVRRARILDEIAHRSPDILCLQELEQADFDGELGDVLRARYCGYFAARCQGAAALDYGTTTQRVDDGCAVFWRRDLFTLIHAERLQFNQASLAACDAASTHHRDRALRFNMHHNAAAIVTLRHCSSASKMLRIATTHLLSASTFADARLLQTAVLVDRLESLAAADNVKAAVVICGDLNARQASPSLNYLTKGFVPRVHFKGSDFGRFTADDVLVHRLGPLTDAIKEGIAQSKLTHSASAHKSKAPKAFAKRIDHIIYSSCMSHLCSPLKLTSILGDILPSLNRVSPIPNAVCPSDHIPMMCALEFGDYDASLFSTAPPASAKKTKTGKAGQSKQVPRKFIRVPSSYTTTTVRCLDP